MEFFKPAKDINFINFLILICRVIEVEDLEENYVYILENPWNISTGVYYKKFNINVSYEDIIKDMLENLSKNEINRLFPRKNWFNIFKDFLQFNSNKTSSVLDLIDNKRVWFKGITKGVE